MKKTISFNEILELVKKILKKAEQYAHGDDSLLSELVDDIKRQAYREANALYLEDIERRYLSAVYTSIDMYVPPCYLTERMERIEMEDK